MRILEKRNYLLFFSSQKIQRSKTRHRTNLPSSPATMNRNKKLPLNSSLENMESINDEIFKTALDNWLEFWDSNGYELATNTWTTDMHNRSDENNTSHSSDDSCTNIQNEQILIDLWREHYLSTYDKFLREYCFNHDLDYEQFVHYISTIYIDSEHDLRIKTVHRFDVNKFFFF